MKMNKKCTSIKKYVELKVPFCFNVYEVNIIRRILGKGKNMFHNIKSYLFSIIVFMVSITSSFGVTITYNLNGGHLPSGETSYSVESNDNSGNVILENPVKIVDGNNYAFVGWCKSNDYNNGECSSPKCVVENNGVSSIQWTVPCAGDTLTNDTTYIALWNYFECPKANRSGDGTVEFGEFFYKGSCFLLVAGVEHPELMDTFDGDFDAVDYKIMLCRETETPGDYNDCTQSYRICNFDDLMALADRDNDGILARWCNKLGLNDCSTLFDARHLSSNDVTEYTNELVSENVNNISCSVSGTCTTQLSILGVPMCMITDINDASDPALTVIHENGPYYINLVTEEDSENPAPLVTGSEHAIRIITERGTYNVVGESPPNE